MRNEKLNILFDHQAFDMQDFGGISRYFANLISGINNTDAFTGQLPLVYSSNYYIKHNSQWLNNYTGQLLLNKLRKRAKWNKRLNKFHLLMGRYDVFHPTYFDPYFLDSLKKPLVITVHDMIYENRLQDLPESNNVISNKKKLIESADLIIAISEYTKCQILRHFPQVDKKVKVVYHALAPINLEASTLRLPERYILFVGDRKAPYKNFNTFLRGIGRLLLEEKSLYLVCVGGNVFTRVELEVIRTLGISGRVIQFNASEPEIIQLYKDAEVFVYPSLEEGFGLPILEAFKYNCPIACSSTSCFPEIAGNGASYFEPTVEESIYRVTREIILDIELRQHYLQNGKDQLKKFTFEKSLAETLLCYENVSSKNLHR